MTVEEVEFSQTVDIPEDAQPAPITFNKIRFAVPSGTPVLSQSPRGFWGLFSCAMPYTTEQRGISSRSFPNDDFRRVFFQSLQGQGYDVAGDPGRLFDEEEDQMRAVYAIGARVVDVKTDICQKTSFFFGFEKGVTGEANIVVEWTVFDLLKRRNVLKLETMGYATLKAPNYDGVTLLLEEAFALAAHNLGADETFYNLVIRGVEPDSPPKTIMDIHESPVGMFDPDENIIVAARPVSKEPAVGRLDALRESTVLIQAGSSHGSGFFITEQGHILTNAHVVGNAVKVRVVTSGKREKLVGEVLRVDRRRDVAVLRLEDVPDDVVPVVLPVRKDEPRVGEDVFAIGAPRLTRLQDTVTKGIVSANRYDRHLRLPFIQADVDIYGGNSGGPLLDANGNIIGMSVLGFYVSTDTLGGLNWFIPVQDALEKLNIQYE